MTILSIDSSTQTASAALLTEKYITAEISINAREANPTAPAHSETLLPSIDHLFSVSGMKLGDVDAIACVCGPGSFTGLRIGAATAMGLAGGANIPIVPVPTLDSLAYNNFIGDIKASNSGTITVPLLDARCGQVYSALYKNNLRLTDYLAEDIRDVLRILSLYEYDRAVFCGDGADAYKDIIRESVPDAVFAPLHLSRCRAASAGVCALRMIADGFKPVSDFELLYVRKPQAVRDRERAGKNV